MPHKMKSEHWTCDDKKYHVLFFWQRHSNNWNTQKSRLRNQGTAPTPPPRRVSSCCYVNDTRFLLWLPPLVSAIFPLCTSCFLGRTSNVKATYKSWTSPYFGKVYRSLAFRYGWCLRCPLSPSCTWAPGCVSDAQMYFQNESWWGENWWGERMRDDR